MIKEEYYTPFEPRSSEQLQGYVQSQAIRRVRTFHLPLNPVLTSALTAVMTVVMVAAYLILSNHLISRGFSLNESKQQLDSLKKSNRELELAVMTMESSDGLQKRVQELGMVAAGEIDYIEVKHDGLALRR